MVKLIEKYKVFSIFFLIFIIGLLSYKDYGLAIDDEIYRENGIYYKNLIKEYLILLSKFDFNGIKILEEEVYNNPIRNHPAIFETTLAFLSEIFNIEEINEIYYLSHFLNFFIFSCSLFTFYIILSRRFKSSLVSLIAILTIFFSPRFFAESFYNSRDIYFFSIFTFNIFTIQNLITKENKKNIFFFCLTSALLISSKILGLICFIVFITIYLFKKILNSSIKDALNKTLRILVITYLLIVILWPYLWFDPFSNLINAFKDIINEHNQLKISTLFLGEYFSSTSTPSYYRILWFVITTPVIVSFFFVFGFFLMIKDFVEKFSDHTDKGRKLLLQKDDFLDFYILFTFLSVIFLTITYNISQFNGWRHIYFLYALIIYMTVYFYIKIVSIKKSPITLFTNCLVILSLIYHIYWIYKFHPFQYNYFNIISRHYIENKFDKDYWGVSNYNSIKYIIENDKSDQINITTISFADLSVSILKLEKQDRDRIKIVHNFNEAEYVIDNYMKRIGKNYKISKNEYSKFYEIKVNEYVINTVYKRN